jgi:UDPglucose 6-dehydrogenase
VARALLFPGVGYGGSCFAKDARASAALARANGIEPRILDAAHAVKQCQERVLLEKIRQHFSGRLAGRTIAVWGLSFKAATDDIREAPALVLIDDLLSRGAIVRVHDPVAMPNVRRLYGARLEYCDRPEDACAGADALAILTEWKEFAHPDFGRIKSLMRQPIIVDGRNLYDPRRIRDAGFTYYSIGRPAAKLGE